MIWLRPSTIISRTSAALGSLFSRKNCSQMGKIICFIWFSPSNLANSSLTVVVAMFMRTARCWSASTRPLMAGSTCSTKLSEPTLVQIEITCLEAAVRTSLSGSRSSSQYNGKRMSKIERSDTELQISSKMFAIVQRTLHERSVQNWATFFIICSSFNGAVRFFAMWATFPIHNIHTDSCGSADNFVKIGITSLTVSSAV
mmetsp:Transcript_2697/g.5223  ORF Transcript_2697/g.5223 Transcript_2697/m.5223 type:complete len:200 (+) Transcript_2697:740-1339(+)